MNQSEEAHGGMPVAEYLRASTKNQIRSITSQQRVIRDYAQRQGMIVVRTYADMGKSGLTLHDRQGFLSLLNDVLSGRAPFRAILVQDVSRWGRFQDVDESAHLEFLCRRANIPVIYCSENFPIDDAIGSAVLKSMFRVLAAEYSRELSAKCFAGLRRIVEKGFSAGSSAPYGLRRVAVSADGKRRKALEFGERKTIATDRIVFIPGPIREVECVRRVFRTFLQRRITPYAIAEMLNRQRIPSPRGVRWSSREIYVMLRNPKYIGCNVWNQSTTKLKGPPARHPEDKWVRKWNAFPPIVEPSLFSQVQEALKVFEPYRSEKRLLNDLRSLLREHGRLTCKLINASPDLACSSVYQHRFGSLFNAYARVGYYPRA